MTKLALLFVFAAAASGQSGRAELFGVVRDPSQLPAGAVAVAAHEQRTGATYRTSTPESGEYHFFALPPGLYQIVASRPGFQTARRSGVELQVSSRTAIDFTLAVGTQSESIDVTAAAPLLESNTGTVSFVINQRQAAALPLDGRNFVPLIALSPGVALPQGSLLPRINGSRPRTSEYIYDGVSILQPEPGQVAYYPILDAIEEFRVNTNSYSAEYGRSNGGVIQVSQKSGTNAYHGTLFEFLRNEKFNARNLFAAAGPKPVFKRNQYGLVLGGPIQRNRTFFFADWQSTGLRTGVPRISTVPSVNERRGIFSVPVYDPSGGNPRNPFPDNTIPAARFDPAAAAAVSRYPLPNRPGAANNYIRNGTDRTDQQQFDTRLDRYAGERHRVFVRYSYLRDDSRPTTPLPDGSGDLTSGVIGNTLTRGDGVVAEHAWSLSPVAVNQLRFGFTRRGFDREALRLPQYQITGLQQLGPPASANAAFTTSVTQFLDNFSTVKRGHSVKAGADIRLERLDVLQPPSPFGTYSFTPVLTSGLTSAGTPLANTGSSFASFVLGQAQSFNIDTQQNVLKPRAAISELFVQDDWKVRPRLSVNIGVRYTLNFPSTEANNRAAVFNLSTQKLDFLGRDGNPRSARNLEKGDFGPRLGIAYRLSGSLAVRAGYGLTWIEQAGITTPFTTPLFPFIQSTGQRALDNINPAFVLSQGPSIQVTAPNPDSGLGQGVFSTDRNTGSGYAQQWNLTLQKTFGANWSAEAGYLGSKLTRLGVPDVNLNQLRVEQLGLGPRLTQQVANPFYGEVPASSSIGGASIPFQQLLRPYPRFTTVTLYRNNIGNSTYHAFASRLEKRFSRGLAATLAYTFSKLIDHASSVFDAAILTGPVANFPVADSFNRHLEKDLSNGDTPHVFAASFVYDLPRGWQFAGIARAQSGNPIAVSQANNLNALAGFGAQRPNRAADPNAVGERTTARYFNTAAFTTTPQFSIGSSSRNPVRGPGYQTVDLALGKTFAVTERARLECRAEVFNVANTPPLGAPNGSFGTAAFGSISTAGDPRVFELAVKLRF
jgi:hypothetical protein